MRASDMIRKIAFCVLTAVCMLSCSDSEQDVAVATTAWHTGKVAVVLPMDSGLDTHWQRTLQWLNNNLKTAFQGKEQGVMLEFEWYDEDDANLQEIATELAHRDDIVAVIGGRRSANAALLAKTLCLNGKPLFTLATSDELVRSYAKEQTLWAMVETDISQCEALLAQAVYYNAESVALIANSSTAYGKTFVDWFAFQAHELNLEVKGIFDYKGNNLNAQCQSAFDSEADYILCVPSVNDDLKQILQLQNEYAAAGGQTPKLLFSDMVYGNSVINELGYLVEGLEGVCFWANPEDGFDVSYEVFFGEAPVICEAQVYDAAMMIAYATYIKTLNEGVNFTEAMQRLVNGRDECGASWMASDMKQVVEKLEQGLCPNIEGASGSLDFDEKVFTSVLATTYCTYKVYNGQYIILDYYQSDGSKRVSSTLAGWNWKATQMQDFASTSSGIVYPELDKQWALLVAASSGWANYRHQADVLKMYQILKAHGYTDDRIILIMEDDIAYNKYNPQPGYISTSVGGRGNLYTDVKIDYRTSDLSADDIKRILCGERDERLTEVIGSDADDNVLVFWSGHGFKGQFCWLDSSNGFTSDMAYETVSKMRDEKRYRKMLWLVETCYSGSVMSAVEGIEGVLAITAASPDETSKADVYSSQLKVWLTNRFTSTLEEDIDTDPDIALYTLYYHLFKTTIGSHVMVYNAPYYGSVYDNTIGEYL